ncbi:hypothetical protein [Aldersonia kunmingensis]|uniref:hypothetical protein n=1 Tax=Aldersonia kunmingensis TaxID=408066 RepID=UPI00082F19FA|nr:hypothetical protein [Aldersonia kunmingensis]
MTGTDSSSRLHHVTFAVAPERLDAATQLFTELGFTLHAGELTEAGLRIRLDWDRGIEIISPIAGSTASVAASVNDFLDSHGDGVYTVVVQIPEARSAESIAERYGATITYRLNVAGEGSHVEEIKMSVLGLPVTLLDTNVP